MEHSRGGDSKWEGAGESQETDNSRTRSPVSIIVIKGVKRAMAGEHSREFSAKVFIGQSRLIELGFRQGGLAAHGWSFCALQQLTAALAEVFAQANWMLLVRPWFCCRESNCPRGKRNNARSDPRRRRELNDCPLSDNIPITAIDELEGGLSSSFRNSRGLPTTHERVH